ncbi:MAG: hypothetical protein HY519_02005 [Candidatus Aenigmarchaeota archaeon]|nr:hypothetical protein [Candidatus Aenigmarchaeota archaeon]
MTNMLLPPPGEMRASRARHRYQPAASYVNAIHSLCQRLDDLELLPGHATPSVSIDFGYDIVITPAGRQPGDFHSERLITVSNVNLFNRTAQFYSGSDDAELPQQWPLHAYFHRVHGNGVSTIIHGYESKELLFPDDGIWRPLGIRQTGRPAEPGTLDEAYAVDALATGPGDWQRYLVVMTGDTVPDGSQIGVFLMDRGYVQALRRMFEVRNRLEDHRAAQEKTKPVGL